MSESRQSDRSAPLTWDLSPTDYRAGTLLRYVPFAFLGGYAGIALVAGALALPALLASPELLALVAVLALVGGPLSLLYLWPMIRDPDQRVGLDPRGWYEGLSPAGVAVAAAVGTVVMLAAASVVGPGAHLLGVVVFMLLPFVALGVLDGEGRLDTETGTLTCREYSTDVTHVEGVRAWAIGPVTVVWLSYVDGASGPKPRLFAVPESVADGILRALREGTAAPADLEGRDTDRFARAVLGTLGLACVAVAAGLLLVDVDPQARSVVGLLSGGLGLAFLVAARFA